MEDADATCNDAIHVLKSKLGIYSFQTELASGSAEVRQLAHEVLTDLDATKAKLLQAGQAVRDMELARYLNDGLVEQMKTLSGILNHVEKQLADEKTKSKKSLADANDKISELQQLRSTFDAAMQILEDMFKGREKELEAELRQASDVNDSLRGQLAAEKAVAEDKKAALSKLRWKMVLDAVLLRVRDARLQAGRRALEEHQN
jgi:septal ring factor EnvC (AmiA/AmiB activator)